MEPESIYVLLFKGIPDAAFYDSGGLAAYLAKHGKTHKQVLEDMENNPMPEWEVYGVEVG